MPRKRTLGCITCKVRRIKCDEARPACKKCITTGRVCDGYLEAESAQAGRALAVAAREQSRLGPLSQVLASVPDATRHTGDGMFFDLFRGRTAPASASFMPSKFWTGDLLQLSHSEPAIWHATMTLAVLQRWWDVAEAFKLDSEEGQSLLHLAQSHYAKSISLTQKITRAAPVLVLSLALSCACNIMGRAYESRMHLMAGRRILAQEGATSQTSGAAQMLVRLDLEAMSLEQAGAPYTYEDLALLRRLGFGDYSSINNYEDAATGLFCMLRVALLMGGDVPIVTQESVTQENFLRDIRSWEDAIARLEARDSPMDDTSSPSLPSLALRLYHAIYLLWLVVEPNSWPQTALDKYLGMFTRILTLGEAIFQIQQKGSATLTLEPGVTMVVWMVGAKCRHPRVRRRACALLQRLNRQENSWRSDSIAAVVQKVIDVEEGHGNPVELDTCYVDYDEYMKTLPVRLKQVMEVPWTAWRHNQLRVPTYETWQGVSVPVESCRIKQFLGSMLFDKRSVNVKIFMSSEDGQPGPTRTEILRWHGAGLD